LEEVTFLLIMTFLLIFAGLSSVIFKKLKLPPIIGYLAAGIIIGYLLYEGYIFEWFEVFFPGDTEEEAIENTVAIVEILATMGLVLLMFCIGMELNLKKLRKIGGFATMVAIIQIPLMVVGGYIFGLLLGWDPITSILFGAIISGSSTAVVTAILKDQGKLSKEDVETIVLITVVEDVAQVIILSMASPLLAKEAMDLDSTIWMFLIIIIFMVAAVSIGILFVPRALDWIASKMPDEILLVTAIGAAFAMALISVWIGMSMAIGAFLMGVVVSQANSRSTIEHDITPMKDIFMAMFFISVGLKISPQGLIDCIVVALIMFVIYAFLKLSTVVLSYFVLNRPLRLSFMSAASLMVMGEFAFIIAKAGLDAGILDDAFYTAVVSAALISMVVIPVFSGNSGKISDFVYHHSPKPVVSAVRKVESVRDGHYSKIALTSKSTASRFKERATMAYIDVLLIIGIEVIFFIFTQDLTKFLQNNMNGLDIRWCYTIVLAGNFLALAVPLYDLIKNLKFVEKVLIDAERKAEARGEGNLQRRSIRFYRAFVRINNWTLVFLISFAILLIVHFIQPGEIGFLEHILGMLGCMGVILLIYAYRHSTGKD
jgi:CPA2 family monovalent cation:H+ antiporter-2